MEIKRAIITAAGKSQRTLPLQSLVDRDGQTKTALAIIIEEVLAAGIEELSVVVCPGDEKTYRTAAGEHAKRLEFVEQKQPLGYGHAVLCAAKFVGKKPFLLLVGDHLYVSGEVRRCAQQLVEVAAKEDCAVSAVQATHESGRQRFLGNKQVDDSFYFFEVFTPLPHPFDIFLELLCLGDIHSSHEA
jgi:UTP--glucose-1-phosphate uridylyltransferase